MNEEDLQKIVSTAQNYFLRYPEDPFVPDGRKPISEKETKAAIARIKQWLQEQREVDDEEEGDRT